MLVGDGVVVLFSVNVDSQLLCQGVMLNGGGLLLYSGVELQVGSGCLQLDVMVVIGIVVIVVFGVVLLGLGVLCLQIGGIQLFVVDSLLLGGNLFGQFGSVGDLLLCSYFGLDLVGVVDFGCDVVGYVMLGWFIVDMLVLCVIIVDDIVYFLVWFLVLINSIGCMVVVIFVIGQIMLISSGMLQFGFGSQVWQVV